jgi:mannitol/fructose-specific phosphotransferase system IIA component (Ntr-type)
VLAKLSKILREDKTRKKLLKAKTAREVEAVFDGVES